MAWAQTLLDASFRGVAFECQSTDDALEKSVTVFEFPYIDGGDPWDLGMKPISRSLNAIFYGDDYEARMSAFIDVLSQPGVGELVHPIWGSIQAQFMRAQIRHDAEQPDEAMLQLTFLQKTITARVFTGTTPHQSASAINNLADAAKDFSVSGFLRGIQQQLKSLVSLPALRAAAVEMNNITDVLHALSPQALLTGIPFLNEPMSYVTDLRGALESLVDFPDAYELGWGDWGREKDAYNQVGDIARPASSATTANATAVQVARDPLAAPVRALVDDVTLRETAIAFSGVAAQALALEADVPTLTPDQVEQVAIDSRALLAEAITSARATLPPEDAIQIAESLKQLAWQIQAATRQVLEVRPPLIQRAVAADCNLRLLAHWWYGDQSRAPELLRLNPQLRQPNFVKPGMVLNAFAR